MDKGLFFDPDFDPDIADKQLAEREKKIEALMKRLAKMQARERELKAKGLGRSESPPLSTLNDILNGAEEVLREEGRPMLSREILEELEACDIHVGGSSPASNLSAKMSQAKGRFVSNGRGKGWSLPSSGDSESGRHTATPQVRFRLADPRDSPQPTRRRYRLIPLWIGALKTIASTPEGITSHEVGRLLDGVRQAGLGRVTIPIKKVLAQYGLEDWQEIIDKGREDENVMWRPGPRIRDAIQALEAEALKRASPPE